LLPAVCVAFASAASPVQIEARATSTGSTTLPTVTVKGNAFFSGNDRFYIRGVDYQPGGSSAQADPLADLTTCSRDIATFKQLGINTIRVYTVDNSKNHDDCMHALAAAGIYLALDVNSPNYSLDRSNPAPSYNPTYLQSVFATIDAFAGYTNLLLFFSGNEDVNDATNTQSAPYVKAVTRDMKQYIGERGYRSIPVGYAAADVSENQLQMGQYLDCGDTPSRSDFYAINNYEWCSPSSFTQSGWSNLVQQYSNYSLPIFFSEYGCINTPRDFSEVAVLYNTEMTTVFSGGLVYEYSNEGNGWGIVNINGNSVTQVGSQVTLLQNALANTPNPSNGGNYSTAGVVQNCPAQTTNWNTSPWLGSSLPAMPSGAVQYLKNGAGAAPGLSGGSQSAGGADSATASANAGAVTTTMGNGSPSSSSGTSSHSGGAAGLRQSSPFTSDMMLLLGGTSVFAFASFVFGMIAL